MEQSKPKIVDECMRACAHHYDLGKKHGLTEGLLIGVIIAASTICIVLLF